MSKVRIAMERSFDTCKNYFNFVNIRKEINFA